MLAGVRLVPYAMRSPRAVEYVALAARLGTELVILSRDEAALRQWVLDHTAGFVGPPRRERLSHWMEEPNPGSGIPVLSPSELFLLGRIYLDGGECHDGNTSCPPGTGAAETPEIRSPILDRLRRIPPAQGSPEAAVFEREVDFFGPQVRGRIGINTTSFSILDSYEDLENGLREQVLFERICDLKIKVAELSYSLGLPPGLAAFTGELAVRDIVPETVQVRASGWRSTLEQIAHLGPENVRVWIEELTSRGCLTEVPTKQAESPGKQEQ